MGVTIDDARTIVATLPRSYEALVREEVRFRVGRLVYAAFSRDDTIMGFAFPKEEREALVASEPDKFLMPRPSDMRYRWVCVRLDAIDIDELRELLLDAWRMCVPKTVAAAYERDGSVNLRRRALLPMAHPSAAARRRAPATANRRRGSPGHTARTAIAGPVRHRDRPGQRPRSAARSGRPAASRCS